MPTVSTVLTDYAALGAADQNAVKSAIISVLGVSSNMEEFIEQERFCDGRFCPICGSIHVSRNGHSHDGRQRYLCNDCGKTFSITTSSIASGTRKSIYIWEKYIDCMMSGLSLRKTAYICNIHYNTAFTWRHKILDALQSMADNVRMSGIVEADETYLNISYKGNHQHSKTFSMPRKPRHRGKHSGKRGISNEKVCIPCAVSRDGLSIAKVSCTGRPTTKSLHKVFDNRVLSGATMVTDKMNSYKRMCSHNGITLIQLKGSKAKNGIYNIQKINGYHSQLKKFLMNFNGVSTKYLNNYLIWNNFVSYAREDLFEKRNILLRFVLSANLKETGASLSKRKPLPV